MRPVTKFAREALNAAEWAESDLGHVLRLIDAGHVGHFWPLERWAGQLRLVVKCSAEAVRWAKAAERRAERASRGCFRQKMPAVHPEPSLQVEWKHDRDMMSVMDATIYRERAEKYARMARQSAEAAILDAYMGAKL